MRMHVSLGWKDSRVGRDICDSLANIRLHAAWGILSGGGGGGVQEVVAAGLRPR